MSDEALAEAYLHCETISRAQDRDRWIASLFAPAEKRRRLHALSAFAYEIGKIKGRVHEPLAGEMRLTWWLEAIEGLREAEARQSPVAAALLDTISQAALPKPRFEAWLVAHRDELYRETPPEEATSRDLLAPLFALSARALGGEADEAALRAGEGQALLAAGKAEAAIRQIDAAEAALASAASAVLPAFAPLAAMRLDARRSLRGKGPTTAWRRQIAIWLWGRRR